MVRVSIRLSEEDYKPANREAQRLNISLAELLRRSLRRALAADESRPWMRYAGIPVATIPGRRDESLRLREVARHAHGSLPCDSPTSASVGFELGLLSLNGDFADIVTYPPASYRGIVAVQLVGCELPIARPLAARTAGCSSCST